MNAISFDVVSVETSDIKDEPLAANDPDVSDADYLQALDCNGDGPLSVAAQDADPAGFCAVVRQQMRKASRRGFGKKGRDRGRFAAASLWSRHAFFDDDRCVELAELWRAFDPSRDRNSKSNGKRSRRARKFDARLLEWLAGVGAAQPAPFEILILNEILRDAGDALSDPACLSVWRVLGAEAFKAATSGDGAEPVNGDKPTDQSLVIDGEILFQAGLLFGDVRGADKLRELGARRLAAGLLDATDTDGTPDAALMPRLKYCLAPLVRAVQWARAFRANLWEEDSDDRFKDVVRFASRACRGDGRAAFSALDVDEAGASPFTAIVAAGAKLAGWRKESRVRTLIASIEKQNANRKRPAKKPRKISAPVRPKIKRANLPASQSDWARSACLRSDWSAGADLLLVAHNQMLPLIDLSVGGACLLNGSWELELSINGAGVALGDDWLCSCWHSDEDADYIEIHQSIGNKLRIDRQILLSRTDRFALLMDAVSGAEPDASIEYTSRLNLVDGVKADPDDATREIRLTGAAPATRVLPLSLPDDRVEGASGALGADGDRLELRQSTVGGAATAMYFDWHPDRVRQPADWRPLTVGEDGRILTRADAGAFRVRIGNHQLLAYRSLSHQGAARSVLGYQSRNETVIGRFDEHGDVDAILLVE